jgi:hypothetical protein
MQYVKLGSDMQQVQMACLDWLVPWSSSSWYSNTSPSLVHSTSFDSIVGKKQQPIRKQAYTGHLHHHNQHYTTNEY